MNHAHPDAKNAMCARGKEAAVHECQTCKETEAGFREGLPITVLPLRLVSEANQREHWRVRNRRRVEQRHAAYMWLRHWMPTAPPLPLTITLTRVAPRELDSDNLVACFKAVQDGATDWLCGKPFAGEDRQAGLTWQYAQRRGKPKEYAVAIAVERS